MSKPIVLDTVRPATLAETAAPIVSAERSSPIRYNDARRAGERLQGGKPSGPTLPPPLVLETVPSQACGDAEIVRPCPPVTRVVTPPTQPARDPRE